MPTLSLQLVLAVATFGAPGDTRPASCWLWVSGRAFSPAVRPPHLVPCSPPAPRGPRSGLTLPQGRALTSPRQSSPTPPLEPFPKPPP